VAVELLGTAAFAAAVYLLVAVWGSALLGAPDRPMLALSVLATLVVAGGLEPVRRQIRRRVARSPEEALARFTEQMSTALATDEVVRRMARAVVVGTTAECAEVWLDLDGEQVLAQRWPPDAAPLADRPGSTGRDLVLGTERLGRIVVRSMDGAPPAGKDERLLDDLATQAGLAVRNVRLAALLEREIAASAELARQVRVSRERLVTAEQQARHRLERDIHDGAQQHLVALAVNLSVARTLMGRDVDRAAASVAGLVPAVADTIAVLEELCLGISPRALTESGVGPALVAAVASSPVPVDVVDATTRRHPTEVEVVAYFSCMEAVQNAVKHAGADRVTVRLDDGPGMALHFAVSDDGSGFDPASVRHGTGLASLVGRVESVGGAVEIRSAPGRGTHVRGYLPVPVAGVVS
jgi:signal transduction histidine kinase